MENGWVKFSCENGIGSIEFGHPQSNSLPSALLHSLAQQIAKADSHPEVNVIVLASSGIKVFCAGASFEELCSIQDSGKGLAFFSGFAHVINACRNAQKLIIGRIQGKAVGGGVGLAAATDYCFATVNAEVKLSELAVGIGPFVVGPAVERKIGLAAMSELAINATEWRSAEWAKSKGLYAEVFESIEEMDSAVNALALRLAKSNLDAMKELKRIFWQGTDHWEHLLIERATISGRLVLSDFTKEAIVTFKTK